MLFRSNSVQKKKKIGQKLNEIFNLNTQKKAEEIIKNWNSQNLLNYHKILSILQFIELWNKTDVGKEFFQKESIFKKSLLGFQKELQTFRNFLDSQQGSHFFILFYFIYYLFYFI